MIYDALRERRFTEAIEEARKRKNEGDYAQAEVSLSKAKQAIDSLPLPRNIQERVEYLRLSYNLYKRMLEFSGIPLTGGLKESIINLVRIIGLEVPNSQEIENAEELEKIVISCTDHLRNLMSV